MIELLALAAAAQVETVRLPPPTPVPAPAVPPAVSTVPPGEVQTVKLLPDLVVKEIRIQDDKTMHVRVANIGAGAVTEWFPVRGSVEIDGVSHDLTPTFARPLPAGGEEWVALSGWTIGRLTRAAGAQAGADLLPEPKRRTGYPLWPTPSAGSGRRPCEKVTGCTVEIDETNNNYAVAGPPRGTPERLFAPELAPVRVPERGR